MEKTFYESLTESIDVELKEAREKVPSSFYETYSALANTCGGTIYLGIKENRVKPNEIVGVANPERMKMDIANTVGNQSKVSVDLLGSEDIFIDRIDGKAIIVVTVKQAPIRQRPVYLNGNPYDSYRRNGLDGDARLSHHRVLSMLNDSNKTRYDAQPNSCGVKLEDLCPSTLRAYRERYQMLYSGSSSLDDEAFLKRVGALKRNDEGEWLPTNACVALLGYAVSIREAFPNYKVDFYDKTSGNGRYDYRLDDGDISWSGNLYDFLFLVFAHISPSLPNPFSLSGLSNVGGIEAENALREGLLNAIFNCDFFAPGGIKVVQEGSRILIENQGRMLVGLAQALSGGDSEPRNEGLAILMRAVGLGERSGYGIPAIFSYFRNYGLLEPELSESFIPSEKTTLVLDFHRLAPTSEIGGRILSLLREHGPMGASEIARELKKSRSYVSPIIAELLQQGFLIAVGPATSGRKYTLPPR